MTLCTASIVDAVARQVPVQRFNWSDGSAKITRKFRFHKALRALTSPWKILLGPRPAHGVFYMPANAGLAAFYNALALAMARIRGYRCALHHHYYRYLERFEWRTSLLTRLLGPNDVQIVLCPEMERRFRQLYGPNVPLAIVPSTVQLIADYQRTLDFADQPPIAGPFCLGHLSNLQLAKGLDLVIEVFRQLRRDGRNARLILAGPIDTAVEKQLIDEAQQEFGAALEYRGPTYGADKARFFQDVHAVVFPTRNDAQPLVVSESLSFGRPILTFARGCIPNLIGDAGPWAYPIDSKYADRASRQIEQWIDDPQAYQAARETARRQYEALIAEAHSALQNFIDWICLAPESNFVRRG